MAKQQEPQTAMGLATVIAAVLAVYGTKGCRASECKQALNHLVRAYGDRFLHRKPRFISQAAARAPEGTTLRKDHVIPVAVLMDHLMTRAQAGPVAASHIQNFLVEHSVICLITTQEDGRLRKAKLWNGVPGAAPCKAPSSAMDIWARYKHPDVNIQPEEMQNHPEVKPGRRYRDRHVMHRAGRT